MPNKEETKSLKRKLFGTDGIRGIANEYPMIPEMCIELGRALTNILKKKKKINRPRIVIGKDTRLSGYLLETALASGICSMGGDVYLCGPISTPGISFLTSSMRSDAGVVISASHNPYQDNGIKIFAADGFKLPDEEEAEIESLMWSETLKKNGPMGDKIGYSYRIEDARGRYIVELKHTFPKDLTLEGVKIALDCANGAAYKIAPVVFEELGAEVFSIGTKPDGKNINLRCGSLHPDHVSSLLLKKKADIGITLDGDADRVIIVDEKGNIVDGDTIMALCATRMLNQNNLNKNTLVVTLMSNLGLEKTINKAGGKVIRTQVGDRYVVETMRKDGYNFGGEQSGHLIFLDHASTGDGIVGALQVLAIMMREQKSLSRLAEGLIERYPQDLVSLVVKKKIPIEELPKSKSLIRTVEDYWGNNGRVVIRYSGTENKIRVMIEGDDINIVKEHTQSIAQSIEKEIESMVC